jgi:chemotaxis protein methyltransferase CheR
MSSISDAEFAQFRRFIFDAAGITLAESKKALVSGRLAGRLARCGVDSYGEYFKLLKQGEAADELQMAIDLLTTNETYFFREPKHFAFLKKHVQAKGAFAQPFRVWSAAGSSGEEAYSIAMLLEDCAPGQQWEVLCSDISARVLNKARRGHYPTARLEQVPPGYLKRFCLKGHGDQEGTMLITRALRDKVKFMQVNLNVALPKIGQFDFIFLRNVLIYFNGDTKRQVMKRMLSVLRPGGYLFIGHSENLAGVTDALEHVAPAIFRKPQ